MGPDLNAVTSYLLALQDDISAAISRADGGAEIREDRWTRSEGGGGRSRVIEHGEVFEKAGVGFSHVFGSALPASATATRPELAGKSFHAVGISVVVHPRNPHVPTTHMNVRYFMAGPADTAGAPAVQNPNAKIQTPTWWFGGGFDLTPCFGYEEDAIHWHKSAKAACDPHGADLFPRYKRWCDDYFFLKHRGEARGIGGIFFDDHNVGGFIPSFAFMRSIGDAFLGAYLPIVERRKLTSFTEREREFQLYRRGRYVEFNLVWDRGTLFGLQSGGRTESILMSLPPLVSWRYDWKPEPGTREAELYEKFLKPRDWVT